MPLYVLASLQLLSELREYQRFQELYERGTQDFDVAHNVRWQWELIMNRLAKRIEAIADEVERQNEEYEKLLQSYEEKLEKRRKENAALEERYARMLTDTDVSEK